MISLIALIVGTRCSLLSAAFCVRAAALLETRPAPPTSDEEKGTRDATFFYDGLACLPSQNVYCFPEHVTRNYAFLWPCCVPG